MGSVCSPRVVCVGACVCCGLAPLGCGPSSPPPPACAALPQAACAATAAAATAAVSLRGGGGGGGRPMVVGKVTLCKLLVQAVWSALLPGHGLVDQQSLPTARQAVGVCGCMWGVAPYYRGRPVWVGRWVREGGPCASENDTRGACTGALRVRHPHLVCGCMWACAAGNPPPPPTPARPSSVETEGCCPPPMWVVQHGTMGA